MPKRMTHKEFVERAEEVHGHDSYDYASSNYINTKTKMIINCLSCGNEFQQTPGDHLGGSGCPNCAIKRRASKRTTTTKDFIDKSIEMNGPNKFSYGKTVISGNNNSQVTIYCNNCLSYFHQKIKYHLRGHGCNKCSKTAKVTHSEFVRRCNEVHNFKYIYLSEFNGFHNKILIKCPKHGEFHQKALNHLFRSSGCPHCWNDNRHKAATQCKSNYRNVDGFLILYRVLIEDTINGFSFEKIGVTSKESVYDRFHNLPNKYKLTVLNQNEVETSKALDLEFRLLEELDNRDIRYKIHEFKNSYIKGWTECYGVGLLDDIIGEYF